MWTLSSPDRARRLLIAVLFLHLLTVTSQEESRIVGGHECPRQAQPYQVILSNSRKNWPDVQCGGVLIEADWVLTAAHCDNRGDIFTRMGDHSLRVNEGSEQCITSAEKFPHPDYNPNTHDNDIMLIRLRNPVFIDQFVRPIALATECVQPGTRCQVSGWGTIKTPQTQIPDLLQCAEVYTISNEKCNEIYPNSITENMLCANVKQGGMDACQGDSGGPLVCDNQLQGIVSWGMKLCAQKGDAGVYTKVCQYIDWIRHIIQSYPGSYPGSYPVIQTDIQS